MKCPVETAVVTLVFSGTDDHIW